MKKIKIISIALISLCIFSGGLVAETTKPKKLTLAEKKAAIAAEFERNRSITEGTPTLKEGKELWRLGVREKDRNKMFEYYNQSAEKGYYMALFELGEVYKKGKYGEKVDEAKAFEYYKKSAEAGHPSHKRIVAVQLYYDYFNSEDHKAWGEAGIKLIKEAAADGDEQSQRFIEGIEKNSK